MTPSPRTSVVQINGCPITFASFEALDQEASVLRQAIRNIEAGLLSVNSRDGSAWRQIEGLATDLVAVLTAMEQWLDSDEAALNTEIEAACKAIREI